GGPVEALLRWIDGKDAPEIFQGQTEKERGPEEAGGLRRGGGRVGLAEAGGGEEMVRRHHEGRQHGGPARRGVPREGFAETASGLPRRHDDEVVGEVEETCSFPVAGEEGDGRFEDRTVPAEEMAGGFHGGERRQARLGLSSGLRLRLDLEA